MFQILNQKRFQSLTAYGAPRQRWGLSQETVCVMALVLVDPNSRCWEIALYLEHSVSDDFRQKGTVLKKWLHVSYHNDIHIR